MFNSLALIALLGVFLVNATPMAIRMEPSLCERYPHLNICALRYDVEQAIQEMSYLVRVAEQHQPQALTAQPSDELITGKDKRKSAFVRFGKRSDPEESSEPIDVLLNSRPTRKSSFVRFG